MSASLPDSSIADLGAPASSASLPRAWQDESGDSYWGDGHIDPTTFVLATVVDVAECCGPDEAVEHLFAWVDPSRLRHRAANLNAERKFDHASARKTVQDLIDSVQHVWFYEDADNDEVWHPCKADHPSAMPITKLAL